ncbi:MAG: class I SAM-dependent methyltransferase [Patescibacteria group bacterium]
MFQAKPSKYFFESRVQQLLEARPGVAVRMLEIGSGTSVAAENLLKKFPLLDYVGIEPDGASVVAARQRLAGIARAKVLHGMGYGGTRDEALEQPFDFVFSLSVLEHVKDLETFIEYSIQKARPGGNVIHLYDLGHSLYPSSLKESLQTRLCGSPLLRFFPEGKVARYLATPYVEGLLRRGCDIQEITFHNMPNHVAMLKSNMTEPFISQVSAFEYATFGNVPGLKIREKLFPSVCFWATKKTA